jgi:hypothetical protein
MAQANEGMKPGDEVPPDTPGSGEQLCPRCNGSGQAGGQACPDCEGTGTIVQGIGGG